MFPITVRMHQGAAVVVDVQPFDTAGDVKRKVRSKLSGVSFHDEVTQKAVELFSFGSGLHCTVDGVQWKPKKRGMEKTIVGHAIHHVELDGRMLRLGGPGSDGVTLPRPVDKVQDVRLLARLRRVLDHARVTHNVPRDPIAARRMAKPTSDPQPAPAVDGSRRTHEVTTLDGQAGWVGATGYVHKESCAGTCGDSCLPRAQPAGTDGALLRGAAARGDCDGISALLRRGAPVDSTAVRSGMSALHFAARHGHLNAVQLLLSVGAYASIPDKSGQTPESLARANGYDRCAELLAAAFRPSGGSFAGEWRQPTSPGRAGSPGRADLLPAWQRAGMRDSSATGHQPHQPQILQRSWRAGEIVSVVRNALQVEAACRAEWAGWSQRKGRCIGLNGRVVETAMNRDRGQLVLVSFEPPDDALHADAAESQEWWLPASVLRPGAGQPDADAAVAAVLAEAEASPRAASPRGRGGLRMPPTPRGERWRFLFAGREVRDWETMDEVGVHLGDTLQLWRDGGGYGLLGAGGAPPHEAPRRPPPDSNNLPQFADLGFAFMDG